MRDSKQRLIKRLKITREHINAVPSESGRYSIENSIILKNQIAIMNALTDLKDIKNVQIIP